MSASVTGFALPEPFLRFELEPALNRLGLLHPIDPARWAEMQRGVRTLGRIGGPQRVFRHVVAPLANLLGYGPPTRQTPVRTREGLEDGGWLMTPPERVFGRSGGRLPPSWSGLTRPSQANGIRVVGSGPAMTGDRLNGPYAPLPIWAVGSDTDLDSPHRSGRAYRFSPTRSAQRVLRARQCKAGLLTDGATIRLLLCDATAPDSTLDVALTGWDAQDPPESARLLAALASPSGIASLPTILEAARLSQARITKELRTQARTAIEGFLGSVVARNPAHAASAQNLWQEGLILVYRLLFVLKLESASAPGTGFSFAATTLWRQSLSPNQALGPLVRRHLDQGHDTGRMLEDGLRAVVHAFRDGLTCGALSIAPLGGALFGASSTPVLEALSWGEHATALLLDRLLWTTPHGRPRERVHYGALDVEDLGHIYEALLELEPGIATVPMIRQRRAKMEIVVPGNDGGDPVQPGAFFLRAGAGRKSSGSYYTPHEFVRLLVRETLGPLVAAASPDEDPDPLAILRLRVVDPAAGSGHFLIEACRFLGEALYAACRLCDEGPPAWRERLEALRALDPALPAYLPTRSVQGIAPWRAQAICRRLVAVHCLYGVDRNKLAVELAKLALWLESYAEGLPLTFLDHRLVHGDSVAGPFLADLATLPVGGGPLDPLLARGVADRLTESVNRALAEVAALNASIGRDIGDLLTKDAAKARLDEALAPVRALARAWSGAVALGERDCDDEWQALARIVADTGVWPPNPTPRQTALLTAGEAALPWDLTFPEAFRGGKFDAVLSNPPWDVLQYRTEDFVAAHDLSVLDAPNRRARQAIEQRVLAEPAVATAFAAYRSGYEQQKRLAVRLFPRRSAANLDAFQLFAERNLDLAKRIGVLLPSAFHANDSVADLRRRYFRERAISFCWSFENRRKLFDIDSRFKFCLVVAGAPGPTRSLRCAFYLESPADLDDPARIMDYDADFLAASGGTPLELRGTADLAIARQLYRHEIRFGPWCETLGIRFGCDLHMTADAHRFQPAGAAPLILHEGKTFHQFTDRWDTPPRYSVSEMDLRDKPTVLEAVRHPRIAFRDIARSNDERTMIATIMPPGSVFGHTATVEKHPGHRPPANAFAACALMNSFVFDWLVRQKTATHLSLYIVADTPVPIHLPDTLSETAQRLCTGLPGLDERWRLRANADALIAKAYGLTRSEYAHLLNSFSHKSFPAAPAWCLEAFDRQSLT